MPPLLFHFQLRWLYLHLNTKEEFAPPPLSLSASLFLSNRDYFSLVFYIKGCQYRDQSFGIT